MPIGRENSFLKVIFFFFTIIFYQLAFSQNNEVLRFCSIPLKHTTEVKESILFLKTESDKLRFFNNCYELSTDKSRSELFTKFILKNHPTVTVTSLNAPLTDQVCRLKFIKEIRRSENKKNLSVKLGKITPHYQDKNSKLIEVISAQVLYGKSLEVDIDGSLFSVKCAPRGKGFFIEITAITTSLSILNSLTLERSEKKLLGSYDREYNNKSRRIQIVKNKLKYHKGIEKVNLYLKVE